MPGPFGTRRYQSGDGLNLNAAALNSMLAAAGDAQRGRFNPDAMGRPGQDCGASILVVNSTGQNMPYLSIVGLGDPVFTPVGDEAINTFQQEVALEASVPASPTHVGRWAILTDPTGPGSAGEARVAGACPCRLNVVNESDQFADIDDGILWRLKSGPSGSARILWKEDGTGEKWAVVLLAGGRKAGEVFPVNLSQVGGADGDETAQATWTYDVTDEATGQTLAEAVDPTDAPHKHQRPSAGSMIAATGGLAHYKSDGTLVLDQVNEVAEQEVCPET